MQKEWRNHLGERCYYWNWEGTSDGYNSLWAKDLDHLKEKMAVTFKDSSLKVAWSTVREVTEAEAARIDRAAYLAWC